MMWQIKQVSYMKIVFLLKFDRQFFGLDGPIDKMSVLDGKYF